MRRTNLPSRSTIAAGAMTTMLMSVVTGTLMVPPRDASAHTLLTAPKPRDDRDGYKDLGTMTAAPCGIARAATQPSTTLTAGSSYTITWEETVNHPGCFLVDFAASGDANFQMLANVPHVATGATPRPYSLPITLPAEACTDCTIRVRQIMLSSDSATCPPATIPLGVTYYTCANVVLTSGSGSSGGGGEGGGGEGTPPPDSGGCAVGSLSPSASRRVDAGAGVALVAATALLMRSRRRRRSSPAQR
jgi:hypothetical protein